MGEIASWLARQFHECHAVSLSTSRREIASSVELLLIVTELQEATHSFLLGRPPIKPSQAHASQTSVAARSTCLPRF